MDEWTVRGKTVFITGAARGLGAETARRVAARGANVALVGLEPEELERVGAQCGSNAAWFECDVTDREALAAAVEGTVERFGGIDVCMANAGIASISPVRLTDPEAFERTIEVNLLGVWRTVRACLPHIVERQGYVLVISSLAAAMHAPGMAAYSASKAGVEAFADSLRAEVKHLGVGVGVGYFYYVDTDMLRGGDSHPVVSGLRAELSRGPLSKSSSLADVGQALADGIENRRRWVVVPKWGRAVLVLRTAMAPLIELGSRDWAEQGEARFEEDVRSRGAKASSAPMGPGGEAGAGQAAAPDLAATVPDQES